MKKTSYLRTTALIAALALTISSFGQYSGLTMNVSRNSSNGSENNVDLKADAKRTALDTLKQINMKVYQDFEKTSKHADAIKVSQTNDNIFVAFDADDAHQRICYNSKGKKMYHIQYFGIDKIPSDVLDLVKTEYPFYTPLRGARVDIDDKTAYLVDIDGKRSFKTIRVIDGQFDVYSTCNK